MSNLGRKISVMRLHEGTHMTGVGNIKSLVDTSLGGSLKGAILTRTEGGVTIEAKGHELFIPDNNIISFEYLNEANSKA